MSGRRWSDGLHQAVEAKEGLPPKEETQTLATITLQNYFRMFDKLAGMTGTAMTEAAEFSKIYDLDVLVIPTNRPMARATTRTRSTSTRTTSTMRSSRRSRRTTRLGRPVLIGTTSIEKSEEVDRPARRGRDPSPRPQREATRPRGADHRPGWVASGCDHRRDEHGRSRHRHRARRQRRGLARAQELKDEEPSIRIRRMPGCCASEADGAVRRSRSTSWSRVVCA